MSHLLNEVVLSSDGSGQLFNSILWNATTGADLKCFVGGASEIRTLCTFGTLGTQQYLISAAKDKAVLLVWNLYKGDAPQMKIACPPGPVSALAITPDGTYCAAAIENTIYLWLVPTGDLLAKVQYHYQRINCLKFTSLGATHLISAGDDGQVMVWSMDRLLDNQPSHHLAPQYFWNEHSLPVVDIHVGLRLCATASLDHTCKIFALHDGQFIAKVETNEPLTAIAMDSLEEYLILGSTHGKIYKLHLGQNLEASYNLKESHPSATVIEAHCDRITCIAISATGLFFLTGSLSGVVKMWDFNSGVNSNTKNLKGPVTNIVLLTNYSSNSASSPTLWNHLSPLPIAPFKDKPLTPGEKPQHVTFSAASLRTSKVKMSDDSTFTNMLIQLNQKDPQDLMKELSDRNYANAYMFDFAVSSLLQQQ